MENKTEKIVPMDHRTRVTRMLIHNAFLEMLKAQPIQSVSIKALCEAAGISRGTFYAHYQDIYALMEELEGNMMADLQAAIQPVLTQPVGSSLVAICTGIFQCLKDNADLCVVMLGDHSDGAFVERLLRMGKETTLAAYSHHFAAASQRRIEYFYAFASAGCIGLLRRWIEGGMTLPADEMARMAEDMILCGIGFLGKTKGEA